MKKWLLGGAVLLGLFVIALIMTPAGPQEWYQRRMQICDEMTGLDQQNCRAQLIVDAQVKLDELQRARNRGE